MTGKAQSVADGTAGRRSPLWAALVDDAAIFPPGNAPLDEALPAHRRHRTAWYADMVGWFVAGPAQLPGIAIWAEATSPEPVELALVARGGPEDIRHAVEAASRTPRIRLAAVEAVPGQPGGRAGAPHPGGAGPAAPGPIDLGAFADAVAGLAPPGGRVFVELPWTQVPTGLEHLAGGPAAVKLRTGGTHRDAFPDPDLLAAAVAGCVAAGLPFKCTAGLHHAISHHDDATGFEHHGFANVLLATAAAQAGEPMAAVSAQLRRTDGHGLARDLRSLRAGEAARVRAAFVSFGSCSIQEPVEDLAALGLLAPPGLARTGTGPTRTLVRDRRGGVR